MNFTPIPVAFFTNANARGGAEEHMLTLLRGFDRKLFRLWLICPDEAAELLEADLPKDVSVLRLTLDSPKQLRAALRLANFLRRQRIGILHSHMFFSSLFASPVGAFCGVPFIMETPHVNESWRHGWKSRFFVDRVIGRCVDYYIAVSQGNARYLAEAKRLPERKIKLIRNGCDLRRFATDCSSCAQALRPALGFGPQDPVLVIVGRLEPQKGHAVMLDALVDLRRQFPNIRLVLVGDGALRAKLEARTEALQLGDSVRFVGFQSNIPEWLSLATVVILPSLFEGLPLVAIEALAACRPMVASAVDGTTEVIIDGKTGLTVPSGDPQALSGAIARLLRDPALAASLAAEGRAFVSQNFTEERQVRQTEELYLSAWEQRFGTTKNRARQRPAPPPATAEPLASRIALLGQRGRAK